MKRYEHIGLKTIVGTFYQGIAVKVQYDNSTGFTIAQETCDRSKYRNDIVPESIGVIDDDMRRHGRSYARKPHRLGGITTIHRST